jgi:alpha-beta hydrolase superfamily lysophospholipase
MEGGAHIYSEGIDMQTLSRRRFVLLAGLSLSLLGAPYGATSAQAQGKDEFSRVSFTTWDGVGISGTFYPATPAAGKKDKDAVVMLLHDFTHRGGGGSHKDGWDNLASRLQKEGFAVLSFDFRGFGGSTSVDPKFWNFGHNKVLRGSIKAKESINQKEFPAGYYMHLINDIAAARAFLDRKNDSREVNTSNLIVIGGGQGATLGALWMTAEMQRRKDKQSILSPLERGVVPQLDEPEGKDLAGAFWLSISPSLEGRPVSGAVKSALVDVARDGKVPTVLIFGDNDNKSENLAKNYIDAVETVRGKKEPLKLTGKKTIPKTELTGGKLLGEKKPATEFIVKHLNDVMEARGSKEWKPREEKKYAYLWSSPKSRAVAKGVGEELPRPIPGSVIRLP